jgi:hypothetical protein
VSATSLEQEAMPTHALVRKLGLCRCPAVIRKTLFRVIPAGEDGEIGTRHTEQAAVLDGLDGGVDEGRGGAVRVEVDDFYAVGFGAVRVDEGANGKMSRVMSKREGETYFASPSLTTTPVLWNLRRPLPRATGPTLGCSAVEGASIAWT